ncbi:MAG: hypothetical protein F7C37_04350 [Desulfurococcales archaeon]|nr:hypothetical protein [Desulfurococcales archaeon]
MCHELRVLDNTPPIAQLLARRAGIALFAYLSWGALCVSAAIIIALYRIALDTGRGKWYRVVAGPLMALYAVIALDAVMYSFLLIKLYPLGPREYLVVSSAASAMYLLGVFVATILASREVLRLRRAPRGPGKLIAMSLTVLLVAVLVRFLVELSLSWLTPRTLIYTCRCESCTAHLCSGPFCEIPRSWLSVSLASYLATSLYILVYSVMLDALSLVGTGLREH